MKRLAVAAAALVALLLPSTPAPAADATTGQVNGTPLGYLGCVQTFPSHNVICLVALRQNDDSVAVTAMTGGYLKKDPDAGRITTTTLPSAALALHTDTTPNALEFTGTIPDVGPVDITVSYERTSASATNVGCEVYPVHFALSAGADMSALGGFMRTSGSVNGETVSSLLDNCDATILRAAYGAWSIDTV